MKDDCGFGLVGVYGVLIVSCPSFLLQVPGNQLTKVHYRITLQFQVQLEFCQNQTTRSF